MLLGGDLRDTEKLAVAAAVGEAALVKKLLPRFSNRDQEFFFGEPLANAVAFDHVDVIAAISECFTQAWSTSGPSASYMAVAFHNSL